MSTVVGNMLMILITLSLAAILVAWAGTTYGAFSGGSSLYFLQRGQALQERFVIEDAFFNKTNPPQIMIFVRNVGVEQVNLVSLYLTATPSSGSPTTSQYAPGTSPIDPYCTPNTNPADGGQTLVVGAGNPNNVCEFRITISAWTSGTIFNVVVASARGNQATYTVRAP